MTRRISHSIPARQEEATLHIQAAIDEVSALGGGRVELCPGIHVIRGLRLKSGVELHLPEGAVLRPVPDYEAYSATTVSVIAEKSDRGIITARNEVDIALTGHGRIEAGGEGFIAGDDQAMGTYIPAEFRPRVLVLEACKDVRLEDIEVIDSPMWTLHFVNCEDVHVSRVTVSNNRRLPNTDGIVLDACRGAVIEDCVVSTADDGICLKTSMAPNGGAIGSCENIVVRRCTIESQSCGLKIGTESHGDFTNVVFEDCRIRNSNRGLGLFSRDGGRISNIRFSRIDVDCHETLDGFWGSGEALTVTVVDRVPERRAGAVENLIVEDLSGRMEGAIVLVATSAAGLQNVRLSRLRLRQAAGQLGTASCYDLRPTHADIAPSLDAVGRANAWTRGADGKVIGIVDYPDGLPAIFTKGMKDLWMDEVHIERPEPLPERWNANVLHQAN
ncbi:glycoside hydrolase family 28 protein [Rhizobium sp. LC145]|jgi:polygalacturonase|uniref:polygalacturonase PglB n=1 Tax=Rhizobium sp. LC145 TaxID=1120688 RepID=UPI00062A2113|nr:glycoside hydrolase family 28 protein [Rhizobium sp. LC145]KKX33162.1 polygalacturonase [Rhizobium sp. LC145]TKT68677.1 glycoside hydrolase family 28 protein [Rhizobiaceae bacterium LC148]